MTSKAELLKLAEMSGRGQISLNQAEGYLAEKGLKGSKRNNALKYIDAVSNQHFKKQAPNSNKKLGIWFILILTIIAAVLFYLFYPSALNSAVGQIGKTLK